MLSRRFPISEFPYLPDAVFFVEFYRECDVFAVNHVGKAIRRGMIFDHSHPTGNRKNVLA